MKFNYVLNRGWKADLLFWVAYGSFWHFVFAPEPIDWYNAIFTSIMTITQVVAVYMHLNLLMPKRWSGEMSIPVYGILLMVLTFLGTGLTWVLLYGAFSIIPYAEGLTASLQYAFFTYWIGPLLGSMGMAITSTGALNLFARRREQERREKELEHANVNTELQYLRGQLNPHFLFNALNGIYFLIPRDPEKAAEVLIGFSDLLRYQLYRSEDKQVPLAEELQQLDRFAELSLMRLESDFDYDLDVQLSGEEGYIPPMLLLPLLENAFKHSPSRNGWIQGQIWTSADGMLHANFKNNYLENIEKRPEKAEERSGGIGLENIKRRLELLYPQNHTFQKERENGIFSIKLEIPFVPTAALAVAQ